TRGEDDRRLRQDCDEEDQPPGPRGRVRASGRKHFRSRRQGGHRLPPSCPPRRRIHQHHPPREHQGHVPLHPCERNRHGGHDHRQVNGSTIICLSLDGLPFPAFPLGSRFLRLATIRIHRIYLTSIPASELGHTSTYAPTGVVALRDVLGLFA